MTARAGDRHAPFRDDLDTLAAAGRLRALRPAQGIDFASNDYLALASDPRLREAVTRALRDGVPIGAGGSRLLRGNHPSHEALEAEAAAFFGAEAALLLGGGYPANLALLGTLPQRGDLLLLDSLAHASSSEGARLSRAEVRRFAHNDIAAAEAEIAAWRATGGRGAVWLAVESLYSMDGDRAPLDALADLAACEGWLVIDEAHATGVFGPEGRGLGAGLEGAPHVITLHTLGKALGGSGALVTGPRVIREAMINRARPLIFATAPSPLMAEAGREALRLLADEPERRTQLHALVGRFATAMHQRLPHLPPSGSQIVPLLVGGDAAAMALASAVQARGYDVRGIRPPTVPAGTARVRVSITLNAREDDIDGLVEALAETWTNVPGGLA